MRNRICLAVFLAFAALTIVYVVRKSHASDPRPAVNGNDPFQDSDLLEPSKSSPHDSGDPFARTVKPNAPSKPELPKQPREKAPLLTAPQSAVPIAPAVIQTPPTQTPAAPKAEVHRQLPTSSLYILTPKIVALPESTEALEVNDSKAAANSNAKIRAALGCKVDLEFNDVLLQTVLDDLAEKFKIPIQRDLPALKEAGVAPCATVTINVHGITLGSALRRILGDLELTYIVHKEVLLITCPTNRYLTTKVYPVKDVVLVRDSKGKSRTDYEPLIDLITTSIATKSWRVNGGEDGSIEPFQARERCLLVVTQSEYVHVLIGNLLAGLRTVGRPGATLAVPDREHRAPIKIILHGKTGEKGAATSEPSAPVPLKPKAAKKPDSSDPFG
jgi:hypothetical protein